MDCTGCGRNNRDGARFCDGCGAELAPVCANCGRELRLGARFCDGCGSEVARSHAPSGSESESESQSEPTRRDPRSYTPRHLAERILTQKGALEGERKHVSVLFADVADFTPLAEQADPEAMHELLDRCFKIALDEVHRFEGTINQFTGDGFMALFGAPLALEDTPRRALLAALAIQRSLEPLNAEVLGRYGLPFRMRMGIHSGPVVVGSIGDDLRMDYTAVGDTTNLAARLQQFARPGAILVSEGTHGRTEGFFDFEELGVIPIKGKTAGVRGFEVLGERDVSGRIEATAASGLTPFAGREHELRTLRAAFDAASSGRGQLALLVGEAGIGKSRISYEFRKALASEHHVWLEGHCSPFGMTTAFQAVSDALRRAFEIDDQDDEAAALAKLAAAIGRLGGGLAWTQPYLCQLLALPILDAEIAAMDAMDRRGETYRALQSWLLRVAELEPLVLVFEDLHWIDAASEEFLTFIAEGLPAARILLLVTYRPGYEQPFKERSYHVRLALQALSSEAMSSMASGLLAGARALPNELLEMLAHKVEGNPLFVEEVLKSLLEEGVIRLEDGRAELVRSLAEINVPDRIQDVLMARLDRLPEGPKRAIQVAAVIGREFALRLLAQIREAGDHIQEVIGELRDLELIYEKAAHPELAFMFKHALTHDVAYESILVARRRNLHRIVGNAIETIYADRLAEHYEALALHFELAGEWERSLAYYIRAADKAAAAYANRSVIEHCKRALAILDRIGDTQHDERRFGLEQRMGAVYFELSDFVQSAAAHLRAAEATPDEEADTLSLGRAALALVWAHDYEHCAEVARRVTEATERSPDPAASSIATAATDLMAVALGGLGDRADTGLHAMALADESHSIEAVAMSYSQRALFLEQQGEYRDAIALCESALDRARDARLSLMTVFPRWILGKALTCIGEYGRALDVFRKALEDTDRCGDTALKARLLNTLGWVYAEINDHASASSFNARGEVLATELVQRAFVAGAPELQANAASNLANDHTSHGEPERAVELLGPLLEELDHPSDPWQLWRWAPHVYDGMARAALAQRDHEASLAWLDRELAVSRKHHSRKLEARALELRGRVLTSMDLRDEALSALRESLEISEAIAYPPAIWRADSLLLELARRNQDPAEAEHREARVRQRVQAAIATLPDPLRRRGLRSLSDALVSDPLGAYR